MALDRACNADGLSHAARIWKLIAFIGRYGRQPAGHMLRLPMGDLLELSQQVGRLLTEESENIKRAGKGSDG